LPLTPIGPGRVLPWTSFTLRAGISLQHLDAIALCHSASGVSRSRSTPNQVIAP
jgi:hypothetical protein